MDTGPRARRSRWWLAALLIVIWLGLGGYLGGLSGKLGDVMRSGAAGYLPAQAEATRVLELNERFSGPESTPATVVYARDGGLTDADRAAITRDISTISSELGEHLVRPPIGPVTSADGAAAQVVVLLSGDDETRVVPQVQRLRELVDDADGRTAEVTGPAGVQADLREALGAVDLMLVGVTSLVILTILVLVYRSPLLPLLVLAVAGTALGATQGIIYLLVDGGALSMGSDVQGILNVLVLGAATDYALLLIARFREELHRHADRFTAMGAALRGAVGPIVASAGTVALGLACLLLSDLGLNRQLGPAGAIGIGCAVLAMITFLPAVLVLLGRAAFWPRRPGLAPQARLGSAPPAGVDGDAAGRAGRWVRVAGLIDRRPRLMWVGTALALAAMSLGVLALRAEGLSTGDMIIADGVESKTGQRTLGAHFPAGTGNPVLIITAAGRVDDVVAAARRVDHVVSIAALSAGPDDPGPIVRDGLARVDVVLDVPPDSRDAVAAVRDLRTAVRDVAGAGALVGGFTAVELDFDDTAERDRVVIPVLLAVVFLILAVLLRALVAPLVLLATVVLSFFAAIGVSALVFTHLLGFPGVDSTFPLHAFVFLVALGVDYNIFLMTRVREEAHRHGPRRGTLIGLTVTGGVITSAGVVLAATFASLAVIPLVLMVELAFTVAFGVLLDTLVVRSLLVPALSVDLDRWMWWPGRLSRLPRPPTPVAAPRPDRTDVPELIGES